MLRSCLLGLLTLLVVEPVFAIDPPIHVAPFEEEKDLNPNEVYLHMNYPVGGKEMRYQVDTSPNFDSPQLRDSFIRYFGLTGLKLNQTYYWRAKVYTYQRNDSSTWSNTYTFTTIKQLDVVYADTITVQTTGPTLVGKRYFDLHFQIQVDRSPDMNSQFAEIFDKNARFSKDETQYYYRSRTIYHGDTSTWSEVKSVWTKFWFRNSVNGGCWDGKIQIRQTVTTGLDGTSRLHFYIYDDGLYQNPIFDSLVIGNRVLQYDPDRCGDFYLKVLAYGSDTLEHRTKFNPCNDIPEARLSVLFNEDSVWTWQMACANTIQFQIDTSANFNSPLLYERIEDVTQRPGINEFPLSLSLDPVLYKARIRQRVGSHWMPWVTYDNIVWCSIRWPTSVDPEDSSDHRIQIFVTGSPAKNYEYAQEFWYDTTPGFNSPELKKRVIPTATAYYNEGFIYQSTNYIKMRYVSDAGTGGWSNVLEKRITKRPKFTSKTYNLVYPAYYNPPVRTRDESGYMYYEFCLDSNFNTDIITNTSSSRLPPDIESGEIYYVRTQGVNPIDTSEWSETATCTTSNPDYVRHPVLIYPPDSSYGVESDSTEFRWRIRQEDHAEEYYLLIYQDTVESAQIVFFDKVQSQTKLQVNGLKNNTTYKWSIVAIGPKRNRDPERFFTFYTGDMLSNSESEVSPKRVSVVPNPATDNIRLIAPYNAGIKKVRIINLQGVCVRTFDGIHSGDELDISQLPVGIYVVDMETYNGQTIQSKLNKI